MRRRYLIAGGLLLLLLSCSEKYVLDWKMAQLCKKDGGLKIYEKAKLPAERFDENGRIKELIGPNGRLVTWQKSFEPDYKIESSRLTIKDGEPVKGQGKLYRVEDRLIRNSDGKLMAASVYYGRIGGDFFYIDHFSSNGCPKAGRDLELAFTK